MHHVGGPMNDATSDIAPHRDSGGWRFGGGWAAGVIASRFHG